MVVFQDIAADEAIATTYFACDLVRCRGACCTLKGGRGAPLQNDEVDEIRRVYPTIKKYLSPSHLNRIEESGLVEGKPGDYTTPCVKDRACVFVTYEQDVAKCSFEKAFLAGETGWRKPLSCHLFPIRLDSQNRGRMRYYHLSQCAPALERGRREGIPLVRFLRDALVRTFGEETYAILETWQESTMDEFAIEECHEI